MPNFIWNYLDAHFITISGRAEAQRQHQEGLWRAADVDTYDRKQQLWRWLQSLQSNNSAEKYRLHPGKIVQDIKPAIIVKLLSVFSHHIKTGWSQSVSYTWSIAK